jgi:CheY-like chemotaxis protein
MKILAIDDQQLILLSVEKRLSELGYEVEIANSGSLGIELFERHKIDLVILDINMPDISGLEIVKHIRINKKSLTPIMVMSGNTNEKVIVNGFNLGIDDYMKKPVSLDEMVARIKRILGNSGELTLFKNQNDAQMLQKYCVGVVIPCYNEEARLSSKVFEKFANKNLGYHFCFVNDGSTDNTVRVLENLRKGNEEFVSIVNCKKNGGKAEAVRQGVLYLIQDSQLDYIGYLDADLSTNLSDFDKLVQTLGNSEFKIVGGSRISRMGANISKESARKIISITINLIIQRILGMPFKDTQCGAKVMHMEVATNMFHKKFITKWLFDVEIFMRMRRFYGRTRVQSFICEQPLKRWTHAEGSKLSMKDSIRIVGQLAQIAVHYRG